MRRVARYSDDCADLHVPPLGGVAHGHIGGGERTANDLRSPCLVPQSWPADDAEKHARRERGIIRIEAGAPDPPQDRRPIRRP